MERFTMKSPSGVNRREFGGFSVTHDHFLRRVPLDLASGANGDVSQVTSGGRAVSDGDFATHDD